jgi:hypothetical protein
MITNDPFHWKVAERVANVHVASSTELCQHPLTIELRNTIEARNKLCDGMNSPAIESVMQMSDMISGNQNLGRFGMEDFQQTSTIKSPLSSFKPSATNFFSVGCKMFLNPFNTEEAEPLRQRRKWRDPRCDAYTVSEANHLTHMGASWAASFVASLNATPSAAFAANHSAGGMPSLI